MLKATEFAVGYLGDASPLSLILPRTKYEEAMLVGNVEGKATAVILSGQHQFLCFSGAGNTDWKGLMIPNVHIEVDETSLFDPDASGTPTGSIIRRDTRLTIHAREERAFGAGTAVTLHDSLPSAERLKAGFTKWQIVVGEETSKRVLWSTNLETAEGA